MSWDDILKEVLNKDKKDQTFYFTNINPRKHRDGGPEGKPKIKRTLKVYSLGEKYGAVYFTQREAECMLWMLKGKTINSIADLLKLSPRTVEFYIKNMKAKLGCRTKFELIDLVHESDFMKTVDLN